MLTEKNINELKILAPDARLCFNEPMRLHTTFRIGGPAECLVLPQTQEDIVNTVTYARKNGINVTVLGNCSNVLVKDGGIDGITVLIGRTYGKAECDETGVTAQAGITMSALAQALMRAGLTGFEFASGIPGCLGGGLYMNAGAYNGEVGSFVKWVRVLDKDGNVTELSNREAGFAYRHTAFAERGDIILAARLRLARGNSADIAASIADFTRRRREKQPLELPSAGSMFKRPQGAFAAALIDGAGLKGASVGDAEVSVKHAGFFVNRGNATAKDVLALVKYVQDTVMNKYGIMLEPEVRILGND